MSRPKTRIIFYCNNPECGTKGKPLCPECRARTSMKYRGIKSYNSLDMYVVVRSYELMNDNNPMGLRAMYPNVREIGVEAFLKKVSIWYVNEYFGYSVSSKRGLLFRRDESLRFYSGKYNGWDLYYMEKDSQHFVFAPKNFLFQNDTEFRLEKSKDQSHKYPLPPGTLDEYDEQW